MSGYTIVEPYFELFEPCTAVNYMQFLELCTRNCYKSEEFIKIGSAEKLLTKVVNDFGHYSVVEHANAILLIDSPHTADYMHKLICLVNPLLRTSFRSKKLGNKLLISGNVRMWKDLLENWPYKGEQRGNVIEDIEVCLNIQWPFFFETRLRSQGLVRLLDCNPITNNDNLTEEEMLKHMTMTGRFFGSRSMSHQLVRHRMAAYSQESQRYCNYGKKGLQVICPPSVKSSKSYLDWLGAMSSSSIRYCRMLEAGIPPEDARSILPNATKTEVVATYTLGIWGHVNVHRGHNPKAQWEIRDLCLSAERQLQGVIPVIFG